MADNYLEKKFDDFHKGKSVVRKSSPSVEALIKAAGITGRQDETYIVKKAQLDATIRAVRSYLPDCIIEAREESSSIRITENDKILMGEAIMIAKLKLAELHLNATEEYSEDSVILRIHKYTPCQ